MYYMTAGFYTPSAVCGLRLDDPAFSIQRVLVATAVSEQARGWPVVGRPRSPMIANKASGSHGHLKDAPACLGPKKLPACDR